MELWSTGSPNIYPLLFSLLKFSIGLNKITRFLSSVLKAFIPSKQLTEYPIDYHRKSTVRSSKGTIFGWCQPTSLSQFMHSMWSVLTTPKGRASTVKGGFFRSSLRGYIFRSSYLREWLELIMDYFKNFVIFSFFHSNFLFLSNLFN